MTPLLRVGVPGDEGTGWGSCDPAVVRIDKDLEIPDRVEEPAATLGDDQIDWIPVELARKAVSEVGRSFCGSVEPPTLRATKRQSCPEMMA